MRTFTVIAVSTATAILTACGGAPPPQAPDEGPPPAAPSDVTATPGPGYVTVRWKDNSDDETGFAVYRSVASDGATPAQDGPAGEVDADVTEFVDDGVSPGVTYVYRVTAIGSSGESEPSPLEDGSSAETVEEVDLVPGTVNDAEGAGTVFLLYYALAEVPGDATVSIAGPDAWNGGNQVEFAASPESLDAGWAWVIVDAAPEPGGYTVQVSFGSEALGATASIDDPGYRFPSGNPVAIDEATATEVRASWSGPPEARSFVATLVEDAGDGSVESQGTTSSETTFTDLTLDTVPYRVRVTALPFDVDASMVVKPEDEFGISVRASDAFALGGGTSCTSGDDVVAFVDEALQDALNEQLDSSGNVTCDQMASLETLDISASDVSSLEGMQHAVNLIELNANDNAIADLGPLAGLTSLEVLLVDANDVEELAPLEQLDHLRALSFTSNRVSDLSVVTELPELSVLVAVENDIDDLEDLRNHTNLARLYVSDNPISVFDAVSTLDLAAFGAARTGLTSLQPVAGKDLDYLWVSGNAIDDFSLIEHMDSLEQLLVGDTGFADTDLALLSDKTELQRLQVWGNEGVTDLTPLTGLESLEWELDVGGTGVTTLEPIHDHTNLRMLSAYNLGLRDDDIAFLASFTELELLRLDWNDLLSLDPLVENPGIDAGDHVDVTHNFLDPADPGIAELRDTRGVDLFVEPQREREPCSDDLADDVVEVPDAALEAAIRDAVGAPTGELRCSHLGMLDELVAPPDAGIASLEGLQYAFGLRELELARNDVEDLSPLEHLENLEHLGLNENRIADLGPLAGLTSLQSLAVCCKSNVYDDISPLSELTELTFLDIGGHPLGNDHVWDNLANLTKLEHLEIWDTGIHDTGPLTDFPNLGHVGLNHNRITDVTFVQNLDLVGLQIGGNPIDPADLGPVFALTDLRELGLDELGLTSADIGPLEHFTDLTELDLAHNRLTSLQPLVDNTDLGNAADDVFVFVQHNLLDPGDSEIDSQIADLQSRVELTHTPQLANAVCVSAVRDAAGQFHAVDEAGTYLATADADTGANAATELDLQTLGVQPGDCLGLEVQGAFQAGDAEADDSANLLAVFAGADGFIAAEGTHAVETVACEAMDEVSNDVGEDFEVVDVAPLLIPDGAERLLFGPHDCFFGDNTDPNGDYGVDVRIP